MKSQPPPIHIPAELTQHEAYAPVIRLLNDTLLTPKEVAARWRITTTYLCNLRREQRGFPFVRLPFGPAGRGAIRYRLSDVVAAEFIGTGGPVNFEKVLLAVSACRFLSLDDQWLVQRHLRAALVKDHERISTPEPMVRPRAFPEPRNAHTPVRITSGRRRRSNAEIDAHTAELLKGRR